MTVCAVFGCSTRSEFKDKKISLHKFPRNPAIKDAWIKAIRRSDWEPSKYSVVCSLHFEESCFIRDLKVIKLHKEAVPTLFPPPYYKNQKDSETLEKWQKAIPRKDKIFSAADRLCELHFEDHCIDRVFKTKLFDGSISLIKRIRPYLRPGSVPTLFPNVPGYVPPETSKRKATTCHNIEPVEKKLLDANTYEDNDSTYEDNDSHSEIEEQCSDFAVFVQRLKDIQMPDSWWSFALTEEYVMCAKWNREFSCERRVVICKDFSVKVFLRDKAITLDIEVCSAKNLESLLQCVNDLVINEDVE